MKSGPAIPCGGLGLVKRKNNGTEGESWGGIRVFY